MVKNWPLFHRVAVPPRIHPHVPARHHGQQPRPRRQCREQQQHERARRVHGPRRRRPVPDGIREHAAPRHGRHELLVLDAQDAAVLLAVSALRQVPRLEEGRLGVLLRQPAGERGHARDGALAAGGHHHGEKEAQGGGARVLGRRRRVLQGHEGAAGRRGAHGHALLGASCRHCQDWARRASGCQRRALVSLRRFQETKTNRHR